MLKVTLGINYLRVTDMSNLRLMYAFRTKLHGLFQLVLLAHLVHINWHWRKKTRQVFLQHFISTTDAAFSSIESTTSFSSLPNYQYSEIYDHHDNNNMVSLWIQHQSQHRNIIFYIPATDSQFLSFIPPCSSMVKRSARFVRQSSMHVVLLGLRVHDNLLFSSFNDNFLDL